MLYVIGDVHGNIKTLEALLKKINIKSDDKVVFVGDLIDRGPDSKAVLDLVMSMENAISVKGNHEHLAVTAHNSLAKRPASSFPHSFEYETWHMNGGYFTEKSFGGRVPKRYLKWMANLPVVFKQGVWTVCHGYVGQDQVLSQTDEESIMWDRYPAQRPWKRGLHKLVVGHTVTNLATIRNQLRRSNVICVDNGSFLSNGMHPSVKSIGNLVALNCDTLKLTVQENVDERTWLGSMKF